MKKISESALAVLSTLETDGTSVKITTGALDRKVYAEVNKVLESLGGKWNRKAKAHLFEADPTDDLEQVVLTGAWTDARADFGFFQTPVPLAKQLCDAADLREGMYVLEPSAGQGRIACELAARRCKVNCVEIQPKNVEVLRGLGLTTIEQDFLKTLPNMVYDRVVMNPPFARQADVDHVTHAMRFLRPGGKLVSVMSAAVGFRTNKKTRDFIRMVCDQGGDIVRLPDDAFKESGTSVRTVMVTIPRG